MLNKGEKNMIEKYSEENAFHGYKLVNMDMSPHYGVS